MWLQENATLHVWLASHFYWMAGTGQGPPSVASEGLATVTIVIAFIIINY